MIIEIGANSQITIPKEITEKLGLAVGGKLEIYEKDGIIYLAPISKASKTN